MVSKRKQETVKETLKQIEEYPVIGILNMHKLPARQLHEIRGSLRGKAVIKMVKKKLMRMIIEKSKKENLKKLEEYIKDEPALLLSEINPFKLARIIGDSKSKAAAKPGDISPGEIVVKAGPTPLPPGPVIGELQKVKIPAGVQDEKIVVQKDTVVAKEGDEISADLSSILGKLGIVPMEIGLNLLVAWEKGTVYTKDIMFVPVEEYIEQIKTAYSHALNLSTTANYFTADNIKILISKASNDARVISAEAGIITGDTIAGLLVNANAQANAILDKV